MPLPPSVSLPFFYAATTLGPLWLARGRIGASRRAVVLLALLPLVLTAPALLGGRAAWPLDLTSLSVPLSGAGEDAGGQIASDRLFFDLAHQIAPWRMAVRSSIEAGEWPLWNPTILSGDLLAGASQPAPWHPVVALSLLLAPPSDLSYTLAASLFLATLSAFLLLRRLECPEGAALVGAAAWMLSSTVVFWIGWPIGLALSVAPWVFAGVVGIVRAPGRGSASLLASGLALLVLAGHPESAFHVVAAGCLFGGWLLLLRLSPSPLATLRVALGAGLFALALTAIHWMPFVDALAESSDFGERKTHFARQERNASPREAFERLRPNLVPFVYGVPGDEKAAVPERYLIPSHSGAGLLLVPLAIVGLLFGRRPERWPIAVLGLAGVLLGASSPPLAGWLARLPLFDIALNERLVFLGPMALSVLAAFGIALWREGGVPRALPLAALLTLVVVATYVGRLWRGMEVSGLSSGFLVRHSGAALVPLAGIGLLSLGRRATPLLVAACFALLVVSRAIEVGPMHPPVAAEAWPPPLDLPELTRPRLAPERIVGQYYTFFANLSTLYGLEDVRGYEPMANARYRNTYVLWCRPMVAFGGLVEELDRPFLRLLGVRWAFLPPDRDPPAGWRLARSGPGWKLAGAPDPMPRAFVPRRVRLGRSPGLILDELSRAQEPAETGWIELPGAPAAADAPNGPGRVGVWRNGTGLDLQARMERPGWVVVVETAWRGWRGFVDGREVPVRTADFAFLGIEVPKGSHEVRLRFEPRSFRIGRAVTAAAILLLVPLLLVRRRPRRSE